MKGEAVDSLKKLSNLQTPNRKEVRMTTPRDITRASGEIPQQWPQLTKERIGEIAYALLKYKMRTDSLKLDPSAIRRDVGNAAKELGIAAQELQAFLWRVTGEILDEAFGNPHRV
jgi:hypothetical protein